MLSIQQNCSIFEWSTQQKLLFMQVSENNKNLDEHKSDREGKAGYIAVPGPWSSQRKGLKGKETSVQAALMLELPRRHLFLAF